MQTLFVGGDLTDENLAETKPSGFSEYLQGLAGIARGILAQNQSVIDREPVSACARISSSQYQNKEVKS